MVWRLDRLRSFRLRFRLLPLPDVANVVDPAKARKYFIHGVTVHGKTFRPSDWAERLCGVMAPYRPGGIASGRDAFIGYSPYVRPETVAGVKCVVVDERLKDVEKMAFNFVMNFARDNELPVYEACELPAAVPAGAEIPRGG
jgi:hypothetical protein